MNKKALYAIMLALLLPLIAYFIVKRKSETALVMPRHYLPDSIISVTKNGKLINDTIWHQLSDFSLVNQHNKTVSWDSLKGKIIIADFFFTRCPNICVPMTLNMKRLQQSIHNGQRVGDKANKLVHFLSFSIDPERDSVSRLKYWADRFQIDPDRWWLLTGNKQQIYDLAVREMKLHLEDGGEVDTSFVHTDLFVLIDSTRHVRGYYHGLDTLALGRLAEDLILISMEKDRKKKTFLAGKLQLIAVVFLLTILGLGLFLYFFRKKQ